MQPTRVLMFAATILTLFSTPAFSETTVSFDPFMMRECTQADGNIIYTNKDVPGCKLMKLKELSIVPSLDDMPIYRPPWPQLRAMIFLRTKTAIRPVWPAAGRPSRSGPKIGMPASPRRDPSKLKSAPCMENGSTSTRKPVAGSLPGQTHRMAETCRGEINAGQAIRLKTGLAMAHCPAFSGVDLYRSAVRNSPYS